MKTYVAVILAFAVFGAFSGSVFAQSQYQIVTPSGWKQKPLTIQLEFNDWISESALYSETIENLGPIYVFRSLHTAPWNKKNLKKLIFGGANRSQILGKENFMLLRHQPMKTRHHQGYYAEAMIKNGKETQRAALVAFDQEGDILLLLFQTESAKFAKNIAAIKELVTQLRVQKK